MSTHNPDCLFCGYPRRGDGTSCGHCAGTFPCCKPSKAKAEEMEKRAATWEVSWRAALEERNKVLNQPKKKMWRVCARVCWKTDDGYDTSTGLPTFLLDPDIQAIRDEEHAKSIASKIIDPRCEHHLDVVLEEVS